MNAYRGGMLFPASYRRDQPEPEPSCVVDEVTDGVWFVLTSEGEDLAGPFSARADAEWALADIEYERGS